MAGDRSDALAVSSAAASQPPEAKLGKPRVERAGIAVSQPGEQHHLLELQAARDEGERLGRGFIQPVRVLDDQQDRRVGGELGHQAEGGAGNQEQIGHDGLGLAERGGQRRTLPPRQTVEVPKTGRSSRWRPANGTCASLCTPVVARTRTPSAAAIRLACASSADLPIPASPRTTRTPPWDRMPPTSSPIRRDSSWRPIR